MNNLFSRLDRSLLGRWWWTIDRPMLAAILLLVVYGVVLVAAASPPVAERIGVGQYHFIIRHMIVLVPALSIMFITSLCTPKMIWRIGTIVFLLTIFLLFYVMFAGYEVKGARRWISLPGFSLQPSEFIKPAFAITAAWLIARRSEIANFPGHIFAALLYFLVIFLLLAQPDFGMSFILTSIYLALIFLAGFPMRGVIALFGLGVLGAGGCYLVFDHVRSRVDRFLNPESGDNYQVEKSLEAFQNGGFMGTGPGQGSVKLSLPDAHADFIFSVAGEELGFFFVIILILLLGFIILRGYNRMMDNHDMFSVLAVGSLLTMFGMQALVHMGSATQLLPAKGMTLPFISYGGSSLLAIGWTMGMVLSLTRKQVKASIAKGSMINKKRYGTGRP